MSGDLLLCYYGDDLTGSTDVMEALATRGTPTILFTAIPTADEMKRFPGRRVIGIAGTSRSETPEWMDENLPPVFEWMKHSSAALCHYKVCSTFDSSPSVGSIGRAMDIAASVFRQTCMPLVVGAPELKRYTAFGNLYAHFGPDVFRIDRHPVMSRHPVTPMDEADLRVHLGRQTDKSIGLIDFLRLKNGLAPEELSQRARQEDILLFDVLDEETKAATGRHLWSLREECRFVTGSSGVQYALVAKDAGTPLSGEARSVAGPGGRGPIAVVSGSCSPTTERQIRHAIDNGFDGIHVDASALTTQTEATVQAAIEAASAVLRSGRSPLLYTALGIADMRVAGLEGHLIGQGLGLILAGLVRGHGLKRAVVAGGDTSSHAIKQLSILALELLAPLPACPGSPLCTGFLKTEGEQLEIAFKGGQVGTDAYFTVVRDI